MPSLTENNGRPKKPKPTSNGELTKLPPHSEECEQALLGCCLLSPNDVIPACLEKISAEGEAFYSLPHQTIFSNLAQLFEDHEQIHVISLMERLRTWGLLEQVGGVSYISTLPDLPPSGASYEYFLEEIVEKYRLRGMIRICTDVASRLYNVEGEVDAVLDEAERDVLRAAEARVSHDAISTLELARQSIVNFERRSLNQGQITGIQTGFIDLDRLVDGLHGAEMILIAARPSVGKTSLAMNIAEHVAVDQRIPVGVFSLEMSAQQLIDRMIASRARVNYRSLQAGFLAERDLPRLGTASSNIGSSPIYLDDTGGISIMQLRAKARRMYQRHQIRLFVIDYLQLIHSTSKKVQSRQQEVTDVSHGIKELAKELNVPILVCAQLNRNIEHQKRRTPWLSDLRESGDLEADADVIGMLYKNRIPSEDPAEERALREQDAISEGISLLIAKQRNGLSGVDVDLTFLKTITRFESAARVTDDDTAAQTEFAPHNDP